MEPKPPPPPPPPTFRYKRLHTPSYSLLPWQEIVRFSKAKLSLSIGRPSLLGLQTPTATTTTTARESELERNSISRNSRTVNEIALFCFVEAKKKKRKSPLLFVILCLKGILSRFYLRAITVFRETHNFSDTLTFRMNMQSGFGKSQGYTYKQGALTTVCS